MKIDDLQIVKAAARSRFNAIKAKYPKLKGWLVYSSRFGQTDLDSDVAKMIAEFPEMFLEDDALREAVSVLSEVSRLEKELKAAAGSPAKRAEPKKNRSVRSTTGESVRGLRERLATLATKLEVVPDVQVEIRFHDLAYAGVIDPLLDDPLIDRSKSPKGGIRIVIGTVADLMCFAKGGD